MSLDVLSCRSCPRVFMHTCFPFITRLLPLYSSTPSVCYSCFLRTYFIWFLLCAQSLGCWEVLFLWISWVAVPVVWPWLSGKSGSSNNRNVGCPIPTLATQKNWWNWQLEGCQSSSEVETPYPHAPRVLQWMASVSMSVLKAVCMHDNKSDLQLSTRITVSAIKSSIDMLGWTYRKEIFSRFTQSWCSWKGNTSSHIRLQDPNLFMYWSFSCKWQILHTHSGMKLWETTKRLNLIALTGRLYS